MPVWRRQRLVLAWCLPPSTALPRWLSGWRWRSVISLTFQTPR